MLWISTLVSLSLSTTLYSQLATLPHALVGRRHDAAQRALANVLALDSRSAEAHLLAARIALVLRVSRGVSRRTTGRFKRVRFGGTIESSGALEHVPTFGFPQNTLDIRTPRFAKVHSVITHSPRPLCRILKSVGAS